MSGGGWNDPRFVITLMMIMLFGWAYYQDPSDQAMKGAIIAAFSAAYGFWLGSKGNDKATENTGEAFRAITATANANKGPSGNPDDPVNVKETADVP